MKFWKWFFLLLGPLLLGAFIGMMITVIYPNSMKAASYLCPEDKPDTFIISYTTTSSDGGTGTSFTLYCMSERGEVRELGTWRPMLVVIGIACAVLYGLVLLLVLRGLVKRITGGGQPPAEVAADVFAGLPDPPVVSPPPPGFE